MSTEPLSSRKLTWLFLAIIAIATLLGAVLGTVALRRSHAKALLVPIAADLVTSRPEKKVWDERYFPNLPVVAHDGTEFKFYDDLIRNKIVVVNFIYTSCSNICPLVTARLAQVKDLLGDRVGKDVFFLSITIDPVIDGPELLRKYADTYKAGPGWLFLTGKPEDIQVIRTKLGERSKVKTEHRSELMLGNDATGEWGRESAFADVEVIAETIRRMDPAWREIVRDAKSAEAQDVSFAIGDKTGQGLYAKACSGCHSIGFGDVVGPDLMDVSRRRDPTWLKRFLMEPDAMRGERDPLAVELDEKYPGARMPNLGLSPTDVDDLLVYLEKASRQIEAEKRDLETATQAFAPGEPQAAPH